MKLSEEMKNKTLLSFELFPPKTEKELHRLLISPLSKTQKKELKNSWISIWLMA